MTITRKRTIEVLTNERNKLWDKIDAYDYNEDETEALKELVYAYDKCIMVLKTLEWFEE